jgi:hypothetical protein
MLISFRRVGGVCDWLKNKFSSAALPERSSVVFHVSNAPKHRFARAYGQGRRWVDAFQSTLNRSVHCEANSHPPSGHGDDRRSRTVGRLVSSHAPVPYCPYVSMCYVQRRRSGYNRGYFI